MSTILCSTGAIIGRPNNRDYRLLENFSRRLACDGYEFMMYDTWYGDTLSLVRTLQSLNLHIPVMHCEKQIGEAVSKGEFDEAFRRFGINCAIAGELGASKLVMHLWDGLTSDAYFDNNLKAYSVLREKADRHGIDLLIENVVCNQEDPLKHWYTLKEAYPDIHFIFDTKMAAFHGQLDLLYAEEYAWLWKEDHIRHFHVNDYAGGYKEWAKLRTLPIGQGHVDFEKFFAFLKKIGYAGTFTVESTAFDSSGAVDTDMLNRQFDYIRNALK